MSHMAKRLVCFYANDVWETFKMHKNACCACLSCPQVTVLFRSVSRGHENRWTWSQCSEMKPFSSHFHFAPLLSALLFSYAHAFCCELSKCCSPELNYHFGDRRQRIDGLFYCHIVSGVTAVDSSLLWLRWRDTHRSATNQNKLFSIASAQASTSLFCLDAGPVTCVSHSLDVSSPLRPLVHVLPLPREFVICG